MAEPFLGEIRIFSFNFAPRGWALCNGQLLPINQNQALFALLGTQFGGNGQTNFALPDMRARAPIHTGNYPLGQCGGETTHTLTQAELPVHSHGLRASSDVGRLAAPTGAALARAPFNAYAPPTGSNLAPMHTDSLGTAGGSQPHTNMQPSLVLNICIALQGIFPSIN